jgi:hypothetical protein
MQFKENLNANYTSHLKAIGMCELIEVGEPNKKALWGSKLKSMLKLLEGGARGLKGWGTIIATRRTSLKNLTLPLMACQAKMCK